MALLSVPSISTTCLAVVLLSVLWVVPDWLERRDAALNIAWPREPVPENGRIVTIRHTDADVDKFVRAEGMKGSSLLIAPQVDLYYEAFYTNISGGSEQEGGDRQSASCTKNFVILPGTNSATFIYSDLIDRMRALGFCTLVFDWRSHGRSEDTPGDMTSELFMLDATAIIEKVFPGQQVHVFGLSLGGFVGYQLAIYKPQLVKSLFVFGSTSCWGPIPEGSTECVDSWNLAKIIFSRGAIMRLLGLKAELALVGMAIKLKQPVSRFTKQFYYSLRMDQKVKTPRVWLQVQGAKTFQMLDKIKCPFQQLIGEHEHLATGASVYSMELEASRIEKAEPPILLQDPAGEGYSHFALFGEGGLELVVGYLQTFYAKHA